MDLNALESADEGESDMDDFDAEAEEEEAKAMLDTVVQGTGFLPSVL